MTITGCLYWHHPKYPQDVRFIGTTAPQLTTPIWHIELSWAIWRGKEAFYRVVQSRKCATDASVRSWRVTDHGTPSSRKIPCKKPADFTRNIIFERNGVKSRRFLPLFCACREEHRYADHLEISTLLAAAESEITVLKYSISMLYWTKQGLNKLSRPHFKTTSWHFPNHVNDWPSIDSIDTPLSRGSRFFAILFSVTSLPSPQ